MDTTKKWYAAAVTVSSAATEAVEFALDQAGADGTEIDLLGKRLPDAETVVKGYFSHEIAAEQVMAAMENALSVYGFGVDVISDVSVYEVADQDWLAEWKKHWKATEIGRFIIAPPWETVTETDKIVIRIEPNMAFGTGTHDTTKLCLKACGEMYRPGQTVLDVGTGTGILAIAAAKLGAKTIYACDTDVDSVKIARENAVLNETDWIEFAEGPLAADAPVYDLVFANLTIDVIVPILDLLLAKTRSTLILSGILAEQQPLIETELKARAIEPFAIERSGEWISVVLQF